MEISSPVSATRSNEWLSASYIILSAILYGFLGYFGASLLNVQFTISAMLFWRFAIAAVWMAVGITVQGGFSRIKIVTIRAPLKFLALSSICYCVACTFYFMASKLVGTGLAMVIYFAYPMFVVLMVMLKDRCWIDKNTSLSLMLIIIGLGMLKGRGELHSLSNWGVVFALLSAFFFALYVYTSKFISNALPSSFLTFFLCLMNALLFLAYSLATHTFSFPTTSGMWFYTFGLGIIATALPVQLMLEGLKIISASKASILSALEPVVTLFAGMLLLNEFVTNLQMIGAFCILLSAIYIQIASTKKI